MRKTWMNLYSMIFHMLLSSKLMGCCIIKVDTPFSRILSCGEVTAKKIADYAEARVIIGRRVLYNVEKIKKYLDAMAV